MCGRFTLTVDKFELIDAFQLTFFPDEFEPSYNIAPTQPVLTAVQTDKGRKAGFIKWGLVPYWVKDHSSWKPLINARGESISEKSSFKNLVHRRRCVIFADSFYEWKTVDGKKQPFRIMREDEGAFALAGLWDRHKAGEQEVVTCTVVTTAANDQVRNVHDRMPVILHSEEGIESWMNVKDYTFHYACRYIQPLPNDLLKLYEVSPIVNSPKNNTKECIQPIAIS